MFTGGPMVYSNSARGRRGKALKQRMQQFDRQKFKTIIHYIVSRCPPDSVGRTKLHKAGFYADMLSYLQLGRPMTGETYLKQQHGPTAFSLQPSLRNRFGSGC